VIPSRLPSLVDSPDQFRDLRYELRRRHGKLELGKDGGHFAERNNIVPSEPTFPLREQHFEVELGGH
jgi:hypothetical protein